MQKRLGLYTKICKRCNNSFETIYRYSKICGNCKKTKMKWKIDLKGGKNV